MAKKNKSSKKQERGNQKAYDKRKKKMAEDLTFGLKNKKSKKAQKFIKQVNSHVAHLSSSKKAEEKRLKKLAQKQRERELELLFGRPMKRQEEEKPEEEQTAEDVMNDIDEEIEEEEELTLEDIIEKERNKIIDGTPVTLESFNRWKAFKEEQREKEQATLARLRKKAFEKGGQGLSGRELFEMNYDFKDADGAVGKDDYAIDEDLFLDDEDEEGEEEEPIFDPKTWSDEAKPKQLLQEFVSRELKLMQNQYPKYSQVDAPSSSSGGQGKFMMVTLPHLDNKQFMSPISYTKKKDAENGAALVAYTYLKKLKDAES